MIPPSPRPDSDAGLPAARCGSRRACLAGGSATAYLVLALMMAPSLVWVLLDRRVWTSDEGLYGLWVLELHNALWDGPTGWWEAMMAIAPKAPLLPWIAQLFVPVGVLVGHIDAGLQIVTVLASSAAVVLMYATLKSIFGRRSDRADRSPRARIGPGVPDSVTHVLCAAPAVDRRDVAHLHHGSRPSLG